MPYVFTEVRTEDGDNHMTGEVTQPSRIWEGIAVPVAGTYDLDPVHSFVIFRVRHLVVGRVDGRFTSFRGSFNVVEDAERLFDSVDASFDAASIDTHMQARDDDLKSERFFDAETFPHVLFRGDGGEHTEGSCWSVHGALTIRDIAHGASLAVAVRGMMLDGSGRAKAALTVTTAIQRSDFGLTTELRQESGDNGEADVHIAADVEAFLRE